MLIDPANSYRSDTNLMMTNLDMTFQRVASLTFNDHINVLNKSPATFHIIWHLLYVMVEFHVDSARKDHVIFD